MSHGDETERTTPLRTITQSSTGGCQNVFDTTALALTDMEQANIAYGRNYVRLELAPADFVPLPTEAIEDVRLGGGVTASARLEGVLRRGATISSRERRSERRPWSRLQPLRSRLHACPS